MPAHEPERWLPAPEGGEQLFMRLPVSLPPTPVGVIERFCRQWNAQVLAENEGSIVWQVGPAPRFWQRWWARPAALVAVMEWTRPSAGVVPEVTVRVRAADRRRSARALLREIGPTVLESLKVMLQGPLDRRGERRLAWPYTVPVTFLLSNGEPSGTVEALGKDITSLGLGVYLPRLLAGAEVQVELATPRRPRPLRLAARFIRMQRHGPRGWFEAAVLFTREL
jgi:hypothetical protein